MAKRPRDRVQPWPKGHAIAFNQTTLAFGHAIAFNLQQHIKHQNKLVHSPAST
ncbi:hypothetical protein [Moorena bouillonii]|uniref:hypothetical protein n=1 Tax=Moorena bouillonii TaxID=207920 RepID=UPI00130155C7|nr:hypothetical protein [Moorena bouillonii]